MGLSALIDIGNSGQRLRLLFSDVAPRRLTTRSRRATRTGPRLERRYPRGLARSPGGKPTDVQYQSGSFGSDQYHAICRMGCLRPRRSGTTTGSGQSARAGPAPQILASGNATRRGGQG